MAENVDFVVDGLKVYDPRDGQYKLNDNPALVMADMAKRRIIQTPWKFDEEFWKQIEILADFCDGGMP